MKDRNNAFPSGAPRHRLKNEQPAVRIGAREELLGSEIEEVRRGVTDALE
jgi:hypothetical protein